VDCPVAAAFCALVGCAHKNESEWAAPKRQTASRDM
jgi:hypothetical protein